MIQTLLAVLVSPLPHNRLWRQVSSGCPPVWSPKGLSPLVCLSRPGFAMKNPLASRGFYSAQTYIVVLDECVDTAQTRLEGRKRIRRFLCNI